MPNFVVRCLLLLAILADLRNWRKTHRIEYSGDSIFITIEDDREELVNG